MRRAAPHCGVCGRPKDGECLECPGGPATFEPMLVPMDLNFASFGVALDRLHHKGDRARVLWYTPGEYLCGRVMAEKIRGYFQDIEIRAHDQRPDGRWWVSGDRHSVGSV